MSSPSTSKPSDESKPKQADTKTDNKEKETEKDSNTATSHIGVLEEDDEFEEFPAAGMPFRFPLPRMIIE
jgi:hypothetical protein